MMQTPKMLSMFKAIGRLEVVVLNVCRCSWSLDNVAMIGGKSHYGVPCAVISESKVFGKGSE